MKILTVLSFSLSITLTGFCQKQKKYDLVADFGAKADNKTDCYATLIKAAQVISAAGGGTLNIPAGKYYLSSYKIIGGKNANNISDVVFRNCKGLTIKGNNSIIRVNGNFIRSRDYTIPNVSFQYAYKNTVTPFVFKNCKNITVVDLSIDGGVMEMKKEAGVVEGECYGIVVGDDNDNDISSNIVIKNVKVKHFAADGFLIRSNGENITIDNCISSNNGRQGLSIVKGKNIKCLNSAFDSTGFTGDYGWNMPGAGIDVENEFGAEKLKDVVIKNCQLRNNKGFQVVTTLSSVNVLIDSCFIADLTNGYSIGENGIGIYSLNSTLSNSIIFASIQIDLADQIYRGPVAVVQQIKNNVIYSGAKGLISADFGRPVNITDNIIINLPKPLAEYFPYIQNYNGRFNSNIVVMNADRIRAQANQYISLAQGLTESNDNVWLANGYIKNDDQLRTYYYPSFDGVKSLGLQYFPENAAVSGLGRWIFRTLPKKSTDQLLATPLFTAYKQKQFDKKYLVQANRVKAAFKQLIATAK